jgi:hypothetical protein
MTVFTNIFGGNNIAPSSVSYASVALTTASTQFSWPVETSADQNLMATIMDVTTSSSGRILKLPSAEEVSTGQTVLFNNPGSNSFIVQSYSGVQILNVSAGTTWQIYLTDNSTPGGTWRAFQYGAAASSTNASALAGNGLVAIGSLLNQSMPMASYGVNYTVLTTDRANTLLWTGGTGTFTLPLAATAGNNWFVQFKNGGNGQLTIATSGTDDIDDGSTLTLQPLDSCIVLTDGIEFYSLGLGQSAIFAFDYTTINVSGSGNYVLSGAELNRVAYEFTGVLSGNRNIIVPDTIQQYWVKNSTTGAFTLTVKTASGSGIAVQQSASEILYCNGTQVVQAQTGGIGIPVPVSQGGTGATVQASAIFNLGLNPINGGTY